MRTGKVEAKRRAAGSIHISVPVAIKATEKGGKSTVYTGCYRLTQVQPANQEVPPFRPIQIDMGMLAPATPPSTRPWAPAATRSTSPPTERQRDGGVRSPERESPWRR